ncbi:MAG TPA: hypothetical protein VM408_08225, partial [Methylomirabilota bacterium]|nr:hypothetical protein [Methylomirabilota bacterium]
PLAYRCNESASRGVIERIKHPRTLTASVEPSLGAGDTTWTSAKPGQGPESIRRGRAGAWHPVVLARTRGSSPTVVLGSSTTLPWSTGKPPIA